jgi:hypothetical protein
MFLLRKTGEPAARPRTPEPRRARARRDISLNRLFSSSRLDLLTFMSFCLLRLLSQAVLPGPGGREYLTNSLGPNRGLSLVTPP